MVRLKSDEVKIVVVSLRKVSLLPEHSPGQTVTLARHYNIVRYFSYILAFERIFTLEKCRTLASLRITFSKKSNE
jgi:hypothetical protein